jgi:ABC-type microcin C transport system permease subunit YejE
MFSPLTKKRFRAFRRIKRAWYSLIALGVVFVFCQAADFVCPFDPNEITDVATLEKYRKPLVVKTYDVKTARFNLSPDGAVTLFEGPEDVRAAVSAGINRDALSRDYDISVKKRDGYERWFLEPKAPPAATETEVEAPPVSFPHAPCWEHPFGLDSGGRDVYSLVVHGMRIALNFGLLLALSGMFVGLVAGAVEGYFGGKTDILCQRLTEIWSAVPFLYVMIFIGSTVGRSFTVLLVCYAIFNWIGVSYYVRAEFLRLRSRTFVEAAKCQGFSAARIIFGHILPNALTPLITLFPFLLMGAIGSLAALDFLGFGLPPMTPSCGELLHQAQGNPSAWWLILFPALALFTVMLLTVLVGEGLRDAFDPRQRSKLE